MGALTSDDDAQAREALCCDAAVEAAAGAIVGLAHDLNNIFQGIVFQLQLARAGATGDPAGLDELQGVASAGVGMLHTFAQGAARPDDLPHVQFPNRCIEEIGTRLHRVIGQRSPAERIYSEKSWPVRLPGGVLESLLLATGITFARRAVGHLCIQTVNTPDEGGQVQLLVSGAVDARSTFEALFSARTDGSHPRVLLALDRLRAAGGSVAITSTEAPSTQVCFTIPRHQSRQPGGA